MSGVSEASDGRAVRRDEPAATVAGAALGAGAVLASVTLSTGRAAALTQETKASGGRIDSEHPRFTVAVVPDTQYQFDRTRRHGRGRAGVRVRPGCSRSS